jgi:hypothetical protein
MNGQRRALAALTVFVLLAAPGCSGRPDEDDAKREAASADEREKAPGVTLSAAALSLAPVRVEPLAAATAAPVLTAFGQVLDPAPLFEAVTAAAGRRAELDSARAALAASSAELARVRALRGAGESASQRAVEAAEATEASDRARTAAAQVQVDAGWSALAQEWGPVVTAWVRDGAPELRALADGGMRLLLVTLQGGAPAGTAASEATVRWAGRTWPARLVSVSPRTDPALQGSSFVFRVDDPHGALSAGLNVAVAIPAGEPRAGVVLPESAVVRWSGVRWVYREAGAGHFERVRVADPQEVAGGEFVSSGVAAGDRIVVEGAAVLLSQELTDLGLAAPGGED